MRRTLILAAVICILFAALITFNPWTLPALEAAGPGIAARPDGSTSYLAENRGGNTFLYEVSQDGEIGAVYSEPARSGSMRSAITDMLFAYDHLWFIRETGGEDEAMFRTWEIVRYDPDTKEISSVYARAANRMRGRMRLTAGDDMLYLTVCASDGAGAEVYELDPASQRPELSPVMTAGGDRDAFIQAAVYDRRRLYCILSDGRVVTYAAGSARLGTELATGTAQALSATGVSVFFTDSAAGIAYYSANGIMFRAELPDWVLSVRACVPLGTEGFTAIVSSIDGYDALLRYDGSNFLEPVRLKASPATNMRFSLPLASVPVGWMFIAAVAALLLAAAYSAGRSFLYRLTVIFACFSIALTLAVAATGYYTALGSWHGKRFSEAGELGLETVALLGNPRDSSEIGERALMQFAELGGDSRRNMFISGELLSVEEGGLYVEASYNMPYGLDFKQGYTRAEAEEIERAAAMNEALQIPAARTGQSAVVSITPVAIDKTPVYILVMTIGMADLDNSIDRLLSAFLVRGGAAALIMFCLAVIMTVFFVRPLRLLPAQMDEIAAGRLSPKDIGYVGGEVGEIQRSMQEMRILLSIREYETSATLKGVNRFVPQGLEKLLGRANVTDVQVGDASVINGNVGIISVKNYRVTELAADNNTYKDFAAAAFESIYSAAKENSAIFLSGDFSLTDFRLLFSGSAGDGVRFGLQIITGEASSRADSVSPEFAILLHNADMLYGVVGSEDRAFPFLSSYDLSLAAKYSVKLAALGARLLVTEQYLNALGGEFSTRYIGFITSPDERRSIKLHEVLDALPAAERVQREQYDYQFQEAIRLYYKNDFYLARNTFSALYKACPGDSAARWYIFACEHFFNKTDLSHINYSIFGMEEQA